MRSSSSFLLSNQPRSSLDSFEPSGLAGSWLIGLFTSFSLYPSSSSRSAWGFAFVHSSFERRDSLVHLSLTLRSSSLQSTNLTFGPEADHFFSDHRRMGLVLLLLLFLQVIFGSVVRRLFLFSRRLFPPSRRLTFFSTSPSLPQIHWSPTSHRSKPVFKGKSIQNLLHPLLGVAILAVGWATSWLGFGECSLLLCSPCA